MRLPNIVILLGVTSASALLAGDYEDFATKYPNLAANPAIAAGVKEDEARRAAEKEAQAKSDAEAAAKTAALAEQQKIADLLKQIRDNQDAVNPNPPTRY